MARWLSPNEINWSDPINIITYPNVATGGILINFIFVALYVIILAGFWYGKKDFLGALAVAGLGTFSVAVWFWLANVLNDITMGIILGLAIIGFICLFMPRND